VLIAVCCEGLDSPVSTEALPHLNNLAVTWEYRVRQELLGLLA